MHLLFYLWRKHVHDDHYWINKAAMFGMSRINRISGFYFISSHSLQNRMIDSDDDGNINQDLFQLVCVDTA